METLTEKHSKQGWGPPPYETEQEERTTRIGSGINMEDEEEATTQEQEEEMTSATDGDIDVEEDDNSDEQGGVWITAKYDTKPSATGQTCMLPWGEGKINDEVWIWKLRRTGKDQVNSIEHDNTLVTIVTDTAATQGPSN